MTRTQFRVKIVLPKIEAEVDGSRSCHIMGSLGPVFTCSSMAQTHRSRTRSNSTSLVIGESTILTHVGVRCHQRLSEVSLRRTTHEAIAVQNFPNKKTSCVGL